MTAKEVEEVLRRVEKWPQEDQEALAEYAREIEARRTGVCVPRITDRDFAALRAEVLEESAAAVPIGEALETLTRRREWIASEARALANAREPEMTAGYRSKKVREKQVERPSLLSQTDSGETSAKRAPKSSRTKTDRTSK
jgi:hypothetical protein